MMLSQASQLQNSRGHAGKACRQPPLVQTRPVRHQPANQQQQHRLVCSASTEAAPARAPVKLEGEVAGMTPYLDSVRWSKDGLVPVIVQHVDTGELLMQAFADRATLSETLQTGLATFYSRSRGERWCKGETSGNFINVIKVFQDCDRDSIVYLGDPIGPTCHTGARTCWYQEVGLSVAAGHDSSSSSSGPAVQATGDHKHAADHAPLTTLLALEHTIQQRRQAMEQQTAFKSPETGKSWTAKLLSNPELLCKKVREEAGELCQTLEEGEGRERAASEMADLLYHAMVLLNVQGVPVEDVLRVLRKRFGTSGVEEKAARPPKVAQ